MKGLSLCGGGSKGAYELGVWKAFRELGIEFDIITGTSIGALNGGMMVQDEYDRCAELWDIMNIDKVMTNGFEVDEVSIKKIVKHAEFKPFLKEYIKGFKIDIQPFKEVMNEYLNIKKLKESKIKFGVVTTTFPKIKKENILINELKEEEIYHYMLATASCFPVFPLCKINGKQYIDGGYSDNLPIDYAFELGATHVIAIDLKEGIHHKHYTNHPLVDYIYPKWSLGSFLYFNKELVNRNINLGYLDVYKYYGKYDGYKYTFNKNTNYEELSFNIVSEITKDIVIFKDSKKKNLYKKDNYKDLYTYINKHIYKQTTNYDYLLKCLDELGIIFEMKCDEVYDIDDFINNILNKITKDTNHIEEYSLITTEKKKREYIELCDKQLFISYLFNNDINENILLLQSNIDLYLSIIFLKNYKKEIK